MRTLKLRRKPVAAELVASLLPSALETLGAAKTPEVVIAKREQLVAALDAAMGIYVNMSLKALLLNGVR